MAYEQKFELVRNSLITHCKKCISENYEGMFDMWLDYQSNMVFGYGYRHKFKEHFGDYSDKIKAQLWSAGKNITHAIRSFIWLKDGDYELNELLDFVEKFISEQLDGFFNDYHFNEWFNTDNIKENKPPV